MGVPAPFMPRIGASDTELRRERRVEPRAQDHGATWIIRVNWMVTTVSKRRSFEASYTRGASSLRLEVRTSDRRTIPVLSFYDPVAARFAAERLDHGIARFRDAERPYR